MLLLFVSVGAGSGGELHGRRRRSERNQSYARSFVFCMRAVCIRCVIVVLRTQSRWARPTDSKSTTRKQVLRVFCALCGFVSNNVRVANQLPTSAVFVVRRARQRPRAGRSRLAWRRAHQRERVRIRPIDRLVSLVVSSFLLVALARIRSATAHRFSSRRPTC